MDTESTAAQIARLHGELEASKAECLQWRKAIDNERAESERIVRQLRSLAREESEILFAARNKAETERDEQRARSEKAEASLANERKNIDAMFTAKNKWADRCIALEKELDEAREQLRNLEWKGEMRAGQGLPGGQVSYSCKTCPQCGGVRPTEDSRKHFTPDQIGHRPDCWFAKDGERLRGTGVFAFASPKPRRPLRDSADAMGYALGVDFGRQDSWTVLGYKVRFNNQGQIGTATGMASELTRPEPKFKVGQKVHHGGKEYVISSSLWHALFSFWSHKMETGETISDHDPDLKPAPKFAVGEWVTLTSYAFEVKERTWLPTLGRWCYWDKGASFGEHELTAQTPQYKHDCAGCVFLGRHEFGSMKWDLWWRPADRMLGCNANWGPGWSCFDEIDSGICDGVLSEARRRAVARGLVK